MHPTWQPRKLTSISSAIESPSSAFWLSPFRLEIQWEQWVQFWTYTLCIIWWALPWITAFYMEKLKNFHIGSIFVFMWIVMQKKKKSLGASHPLQAPIPSGWGKLASSLTGSNGKGNTTFLVPVRNCDMKPVCCTTYVMGTSGRWPVLPLGLLLESRRSQRPHPSCISDPFRVRIPSQISSS